MRHALSARASCLLRPGGAHRSHPAALRVRPISTDIGSAARLDDRLRFWTFVGWCLVWLALAWALLDPSPPAIRGVSDKTIHFLSFVAVSFAAVGFCRSGWQLALTGAFCAMAGAGLEAAQYVLPGRAFEWADMAANLGGAATGTLLAALSLSGLQRLGWPPRRPRRARGTT